MLKQLSQTDIMMQPQDEQRFDLREAISFVWRRWKFIAAVVGLTLLVAAVWVLKETPRYTANALVLLEPRKEKAAGAEAILSDLNLDLATVESQIAIIRSTVFLRRVVEKQRLTSDPEFGSGTPQPKSLFFGAILPSLFGDSEQDEREPVGQEDKVTDSAVMASVEALKGATSVSRAGQAYILSISVTSIDPVRAARLANAVADAYLLDKLDARFEAAKRASAWLSDRLTELRKQLRESEEAVAQFRGEHGISQSSSVTLSQQQLSDLNARLIAARAEAAEKKARVDLLISIESKGGNIQSLPELVNSTDLGALRAQERGIAQREADLAARYSGNHPGLVNIRAERRDVQRAITSEMKRLASNVQNDYELAKAREDALERTLEEVTGQTGVDNRTVITLRELERTAAVNKSLFEDFLSRAKITEEQSTFEAREARVITPAVAPGVPSYPKKARTMMIALFIGLLLGVGGAVAKEKLNAGFTTPRQIEQMLETPLLTSVSQMREQDLSVDGKHIQIPFYPLAKPLSRYNESMRALRSGIQMTDVDDPPKVIQFTSTVPGEGKTTIALSFAVSAAGSGLKVLFIDADLRHPSSSRVLSLQEEPGLVDVLVGDVPPEEVIRFMEDANFWALPAGSRTQNPPDLLGSERMKSLVSNFKKSFDLVIVDTAPVGLVIDPIAVSHLADKVVFVLRWAATARELVQRSVQQIRGHKKLAGVVFNFVDDAQAKKYGKYADPYYQGASYYTKYYSE